MTVDQLFSFVKFVARKHQTGSVTPSEFNMAYNSGSRSEFSQLLGQITIAPHTAIGSGRNSERLRPFLILDEPKTVTSQIATYPTGFTAVVSLTDAATGRALTHLEGSKLTNRLRSVLDPIAEANPGCYTHTATGFKIYPATITNVLITYYKMPVDVKWNYTVVDDEAVYSEAGSVQPLWDDISNERILAKACGILGFSFEKQSLVQFEASKTAQT